MKVGIVGASGYVGGEVLRLLVSHPKVEIAMVTSRQHVGEYLHRIQPSLKGFTFLINTSKLKTHLSEQSFTEESLYNVGPVISKQVQGKSGRNYIDIVDAD